MDYTEVILQIEKEQQNTQTFILVVLIAFSLLFAASLCAFLFFKKTYKFPLAVSLLLIGVVFAFVYQNGTLAKIRRDAKEREYVTFSGAFRVHYYPKGNEGTTLYVEDEDQREITLTVYKKAIDGYILANDVEFSYGLSSGNYVGEVVYARNSRYVVFLSLDGEEPTE